MKIIIDAMGGDNAPQAFLDGGFRAAKELGVEIVLVGRVEELLELMKSQGIQYRAAGENIAMGYATPEAVVNAWMNSSGHRANILNSSYTRIGVGYVESGNYWTQHFAG